MLRATFTKALAASLAALTLAGGLVGCSHSNGKPSKADYQSGMSVVLRKSGADTQRKEAGIEDAKWNAYVACLADDTYGKVSEDFLRKTADGVDDHNATDADQKAFNESVQKCAVSKIAGK